ncbi:hypothetical protein V5799_014294 [Amblyomma americanum]|uniref:THAP-type domain-containing protein n=1 Tax=Amblyomma americanum TaxID=6943 RepID=A0AAQ4E3G1_AMBAM
MPEGSVWEPHKHARLCGAHFVSGQPSDDENDHDFIPSVFFSRRRDAGAGGGATRVQVLAEPGQAANWCLAISGTSPAAAVSATSHAEESDLSQTPMLQHFFGSSQFSSAPVTGAQRKTRCNVQTQCASSLATKSVQTTLWLKRTSTGVQTEGPRGGDSLIPGID